MITGLYVKISLFDLNEDAMATKIGPDDQKTITMINKVNRSDLV